MYEELISRAERAFKLHLGATNVTYLRGYGDKLYFKVTSFTGNIHNIFMNASTGQCYNDKKMPINLRVKV